MITLSPVAINEIKRLQSKQQQPNTVVNLAVRSGGCSGLFYDLSFLAVDHQGNIILEDSPLAENHQHGATSQESLRDVIEANRPKHVHTKIDIFAANGIKIISDPETCKYIHDLTIDYSEDLMGGGFRFNNPQATATCGCGNSFSISELS
ncbi:HesB/IscA family protein [Calothrix sp. PCC 6303]|uniref:HesB/IscA family protein n=1 Tax=Calothrix sp. PCC 6303 TaxID=1170562 RepID=UPI0002A03F61|nr:iron-sulfur cluster assembly accessory protein [Calothrix sp. PCC 6303]AFZ00555.1 iron-sulfur cluster assembly accessory protein [Calothrix sp. PCC 6303]